MQLVHTNSTTFLIHLADLHLVTILSLSHCLVFLREDIFSLFYKHTLFTFWIIIRIDRGKFSDIALKNFMTV